MDGDALTTVCSWNEWDPLEEVIVGSVEGAHLPEWHHIIQATMPERHHDLFRDCGGTPFFPELIEKATHELDQFVRILESEGIKVRRPDPIRSGRPFGNTEWSCSSLLYSAMPRDVMLVVGNEMIEAPMAWRCRHHEIHPYRSLIKEYFMSGAQWTSAPHPELKDELYNKQWKVTDSESPEYAVTEFEPVFDAADFSRCGTDIFYQRSNVTNAIGVEWLRRHLHGSATLHEIKVVDEKPMHIDASFVPLSHGRLLVNPDRIRCLPPILSDWEIRTAPRPQRNDLSGLIMSSNWISVNVLSIDSERVVVEESETDLANFLKEWGFETIPCPFKHFNAFGGSFHCATLDVRRRGGPHSCRIES